MFYKTIDKSNIQEIGLFSDIKISLYKKKESKSKEFFSCFVAHFDSQEQLERIWMNLVSYIGTEYITELETDFSIWNVYIVFAVKETVNKDTKYLIENNKLFLRKIVHDMAGNYDEEKTVDYINKKILGSDLLVTEKKDIILSKNYSTTTMSLISSIKEISNTDDSRRDRKKWIDNLLSTSNED